MSMPVKVVCSAVEAYRHWVAVQSFRRSSHATLDHMLQPETTSKSLVASASSL